MITADILDKKNIFAVVGATDNREKYGNKVYLQLKDAGYEVYPVNPNADAVDGDRCYPRLSDLPKMPDVVDIVVPPKVGMEIVRQAHGMGVKIIWLQPGAESEEIISYCSEHGIRAVHGMCIIEETLASL